jgi:hypothetical protein
MGRPTVYYEPGMKLPPVKPKQRDVEKYEKLNKKSPSHKKPK